MFAQVILAALTATTAIAAPLDARAAPSHYAEGYLEEYSVYHTRYLELECYTQKNTTFFSECCSPLLSTETLADRPEYCTPNATVVESYSASATSGAAATGSADWDAASAYIYATTTASSAAASSTADAEPTTTSTKKWVAPSTTAAAATTQAQSNPSGDVKTGGFATFFYQGGNAGACGVYHSDSDHIVAIDGNGYWSDFSQPSPYCGRWVTIKNTNNGKTVTAQVADVCPTCVSDNSLDLSVGAFNAIASESEGSVPITWSFN